MWGLQYRKDTDILERVQQRATMMEGLKHFSYEERLGLLGLLSLEEGKLQEFSSVYINI